MEKKLRVNCEIDSRRANGDTGGGLHFYLEVPDSLTLRDLLAIVDRAAREVSRDNGDLEFISCAINSLRVPYWFEAPTKEGGTK